MTGHTEKGQRLLGAGLGSPLREAPAHREALPGGPHGCVPPGPLTDTSLAWALMTRLCAVDGAVGGAPCGLVLWKVGVARTGRLGAGVWGGRSGSERVGPQARD